MAALTAPVLSTHPPCAARSRVFVFVLVAAIGAFAITRAICIPLPLERDEGEYAYIAQRWLAGDVPYRDQFDQKPPGIFAVYAATFGLFGESVSAIHAVLAASTALTAVLLFLIQLRMTGRNAAAWTALAYVVLSIEPTFQGPAANTEQFANLAVTLAGWAVVRMVQGNHERFRLGRTSQRTYWLGQIAGGACALGCVFKQVALLPATWLVAYAVWKLSRQSRAQRPGIPILATWFGAGLVVVAGAVIVYFAAQGAWPDMLDGVLLHNLAYIRRQSVGAGASAALAALMAQMPAVTWAYVLGIAGLLVGSPCGPITAKANGASDGSAKDVSRGNDAGRTLALGWLIAAALAVGASLNFYGHYFLWLAPPLSLLVGRTGGAVMRWAARKGTAAAAGATGMLLVVILTGPVAANLRVWLADSSAERARLVYGQNLCAEAAEIGGFIRANGGEEDRVLVLGSEPQILFHARRPSATRYIIMYPLFGPYADAEQRQQEVIDAISKHPPEWVLDVQLWSSRTPDPRAPKLLEQKIAALIRSDYRLEGIAVRRTSEQRFDLIFGADARRLGDRAQRAAEGGAMLYRKTGA